MKLKLIVTFFLAIAFGVAGILELDKSLTHLWYAVSVMNLGLICKWVFDYNLAGKQIIDFNAFTAKREMREEARN